MNTCPNCNRRLRDYDVICPHCGEILATPPIHTPGENEYRSKAHILGIPLVHIVRGPDPATGELCWAKGVIAIGHLAIGGLAIGTIAYGGIAIGTVALGVLALGAVVAGIFAAGGVSFGVLLAIGGVAISVQAAIGGLALAPHAWGGSRFDEEVFTILERFFPWYGK